MCKIMKNLKLNYRQNSGTIQLIVNYGYKVNEGKKTSYKPLVIGTGLSCKDGSFDKESGRFNKRNADYRNLNLTLQQHETKIIELFKRLEMESDPAVIRPEVIREMLKDKTENKSQTAIIKKQNTDIFTVLQDYVDAIEKVGAIDKLTVGHYKQNLAALREYNNNKPMYEADLTVTFHADYFHWLTKKKGLSNNTLWRYQKVLRSFYKHLISQGFKIGYDYKEQKLRVSYKQPDTIALSIAELKIIYNHKSKREALNRVRDLFLFQCCAGVRYSDINKFVQMNNCVTSSGEKYKCFSIITEKTGAPVTIPVVKLAEEIYNYYDGTLPELSNQKYNEYLKDLLNEIDYFSMNRTKIIFENKKRVTVNYRLAEMITTHTARRSFATLMFGLGCPVRTIMKITGHSKLETFFQYIRLNTDNNDEMYNLTGKFNKEWNK